MAETVDLGKMLEDRGAILRGHFVLTSGRHSDVYFEKFRVLEQPDVLSALCARIAETYRDAKIDVVAGPTTGGIIIAFEVARLLGVRSLYIESENGIKTIRRGATVAPGARVLVVDVKTMDLQEILVFSGSILTLTLAVLVLKFGSARYPSHPPTE
ncbi:MAG: orotate phosphoribosyltransferase [Fimbriimonadaceae bacterium]